MPIMTAKMTLEYFPSAFINTRHLPRKHQIQTLEMCLSRSQMIKEEYEFIVIPVEMGILAKKMKVL